MNMIHALRVLKDSDGLDTLWARPKSWRGLSVAYAYRRAGLYNSEEYQIVPTSRGGSAAFLPKPNEVFGEWEVVTPEQVNNGN